MDRKYFTLISVLACVATLSTGISNAQARRPDSAARKNSSKDAGEPEAATPEERAVRLAQLDAWLRRLAGDYEFKYSDTGNQISFTCIYSTSPNGPCTNEKIQAGPTGGSYASREGMMECRLVGPGPGVRCLVAWNDKFPAAATLHLGSSAHINSQLSSITIARPATVIDFGLDPDNLGIRMMRLDGAGKAVEFRGPLKDNTANLAYRCETPGRCGEKSGNAISSAAWKIAALPDSKRITMSTSWILIARDDAATGHRFNASDEFRLVRQ